LKLFCIVCNELDNNTRDELFNNLRCTLQGGAKDDWDIIIHNIPACTPVLFLAALEEWKAELIMPLARQMMVDYLKTITTMVEVFVN
jgi:hypothetical protein